MRIAGRGLTLGTVMLASTLILGIARGASSAEQSGAKRAWYTGVAVVANVVPVVSTFYAPRCLLGYIFCKTVFAGMSVIAAGDQLFFSGGGDMAQARGILHRGFAGDWVLTPRHVSGETEAQVVPDPPPPPKTGGGWEPPPL